VIFDPNRKHTISAKTHHMRVDYSMFEGIQVTGMPSTVLSRGRVVIDSDKFLGRAGAGEFVKRSTYSQP
jgi:dihydropyrimidinase